MTLYNSIPNAQLNEKLGNDPGTVGKKSLKIIQCIKWVRETYGIGLRDAKNIVDYHIATPKSKLVPIPTDSVERLRAAMFEVEEISRALARSTDPTILSLAERLFRAAEQSKGGETHYEIVNSQIEQMGNEFTLITASMVTIQSRLSQLEKYIGNMIDLTQKDIVRECCELRAKIDAIENECYEDQINDVDKSLGEAKRDLGSSIEDVEKEAETNASAIDDLTRSLSDMQDQIGGLDSRLDNVDSEISDLDSRISDVEE
jgi:chromosome segregation ATPase